MMHMPIQVERFLALSDSELTLPSCFVHERKHKVAKRWMNNCVNTSIAYDGSMLREISCSHLAALEALGASDFFEYGSSKWVVAPGAIAQELAPTFGPSVVHCCRRARANIFEHVSVGDIVSGFSNGTEFLGKLALILSVEDVCMAVLELYTCSEAHERWTVWDTHVSKLRLVHLNDISAAAVWAPCGRSITVLRSPNGSRIPYRLQP